MSFHSSGAYAGDVQKAADKYSIRNIVELQIVI